MKHLKDYLLVENNEEDTFNRWLKKEFGFDDLYGYFSDLVSPDINKSNWEKLAEEAYENTPSNLKKSAEDAGLDPEGVCYMVFKDSCPR